MAIHKKEKEGNNSSDLKPKRKKKRKETNVTRRYKKKLETDDFGGDQTLRGTSPTRSIDNLK